MQHAGAEPDTMPQWIEATDAEGRRAVYDAFQEGLMPAPIVASTTFEGRGIRAVCNAGTRIKSCVVLKMRRGSAVQRSVTFKLGSGSAGGSVSYDNYGSENSYDKHSQ